MPLPPNAAAAVEPILARLRNQPPVRRVAMAGVIYQQLTDLQAVVAAERRGAVREMREQGMTLGDIAQQLGVSISRVKQMEEGRKAKPTPDQEAAALRRKAERLEALADA